MMEKINNNIILYQQKLQNQEIYKEGYLSEIKESIVKDILSITLKISKKIFSFKHFLKNNQTLPADIFDQFKVPYSLFLQIENQDLEYFIKLVLNLYKKHFFSKNSFRAYKYFLKNHYQNKFNNINIEEALEKYFQDVLQMDFKQAKEVASKQNKGRKSRNYIVEITQKVPLYEKKNKFDTDFIKILKTKEILNIVDPLEANKARFMSAIQRKAFVVNDVFFNKIYTHFILSNLNAEKLHKLRKKLAILIEK